MIKEKVNAVISDHWGEKYKYIENVFESEFNSVRFTETLLNKHHLLYPEIRVFNNGLAINPLFYTDSSKEQLSSRINKEKLNLLISSEHTIKIKNIYKYNSYLNDIFNFFSGLFPTCHISMNGYSSSGPTPGLNAHYDSYHIFALQLEGEKEWELGNICVKNPHKNFHLNMPDSKPETVKITTKKGDILYLPPGLWHKVYTHSQSFHCTIGIHTMRYFELLNSIIDTLSKDHYEFRADIPIFLDKNGSYDTKKLEEKTINSILKIIQYKLFSDGH